MREIAMNFLKVCGILLYVATLATLVLGFCPWFEIPPRWHRWSVVVGLLMLAIGVTALIEIPA